MKEILTRILMRRAGALIQRFKPTVVAITGSVGKTSTRRAIEVALQDEMEIRVAQKNFNNEIGVPLAVLGKREAPGGSILQWLSIIMETYRVKRLPNTLVLEYGIDHPGDMDVLLQISRPNVGVFTAISEVHAENFTDGVQGIVTEKSKLIRGVCKEGYAILNGDDELVMKTEVPDGVTLLTYGFGRSDIQAKEYHLEHVDGVLTQHALVVMDGKVVGELALKQLGRGAVYASLASIAVASTFSISPERVIRSLNQGFVAESGRMSLLEGLRDTIIIDDSYNAAPASMHNALETINGLKKDGVIRSIAVALGSMGELGVYSEQKHEEVLQQAKKIAQQVFVVGEGMKKAMISLYGSLQHKHIKWFENSRELADKIGKSFVADAMLVKGSQSQRMERVTFALLKHQKRDQKKLVRQSDSWLRR